MRRSKILIFFTICMLMLSSDVVSASSNASENGIIGDYGFIPNPEDPTDSRNFTQKVRIYLGQSPSITTAASNKTSASSSTDVYADVEQYLNLIQGSSKIKISYKIVAVSAVVPDSLSIDLGLIYASSRNGVYTRKATLSAFIPKLSIKVGKTGSKTVDVSSTKFWSSKINATITFANRIGVNSGRTQTFLANKKAKIYPYYVDPISDKKMTEPTSTNWTTSTPIAWTAQDRSNYIKWYSENWPKNGYNWSGSVTHIHHIRPRNFSGTNSNSNLIPLPKNFHEQVVSPWWTSY